jgi:circadian clock protein KaiB
MEKTDGENNSAEEFQQAIEKNAREVYILRLYVTGMTTRSRDAINHVRRICEENLKGRYELEIIDIYQNPEYTRNEDIIAAPTLVKKLPLPLRRFIGDMSNEERIVFGLNIIPVEENV